MEIPLREAAENSPPRQTRRNAIASAMAGQQKQLMGVFVSGSADYLLLMREEDESNGIQSAPLRPEGEPSLPSLAWCSSKQSQGRRAPGRGAQEDPHVSARGRGKASLPDRLPFGLPLPSEPC